MPLPYFFIALGVGLCVGAVVALLRLALRLRGGAAAPQPRGRRCPTRSIPTAHRWWSATGR